MRRRHPMIDNRLERVSQQNHCIKRKYISSVLVRLQHVFRTVTCYDNWGSGWGIFFSYSYLFYVIYWVDCPVEPAVSVELSLRGKKNPHTIDGCEEYGYALCAHSRFNSKQIDDTKCNRNIRILPSKGGKSKNRKHETRGLDMGRRRAERPSLLGEARELTRVSTTSWYVTAKGVSINGSYHAHARAHPVLPV